jgi:erythromycin esterase-like protein
MWCNGGVLVFLDRLRAYNDVLAEENAKAGFYGLDLYSLYASIEAVMVYLESADSDLTSATLALPKWVGAPS